MIDFDKLIDAYLHRELRPRDSGRYYPSEIGNCLRKIWYSFRNPKATEAEILRIMHAGNLMHDLVVEILKSEKTTDVVLLQTEFPIKLQLDSFLISGRADDLVMVKMSGKNILVEVKSTSPGSFRYLDGPKREHVMQLQLYMHATGVHNGMLLYIDRDRLRTATFEVEYDEKAVEDIFSRFREIHQHMTKETIPEPEARLNEGMRWMCTWCLWKAECYGETPPSEKAP